MSKLCELKQQYYAHLVELEIDLGEKLLEKFPGLDFKITHYSDPCFWTISIYMNNGEPTNERLAFEVDEFFEEWNPEPEELLGGVDVRKKHD